MDLSNLRPADGSKQSDNFRRGRGHGSGNGKTAGKGHKGQKARSGAPRPGLEMDAISSAVIGGTLLTGGVGNVLGSLFGVLINGTISTLVKTNGKLISSWSNIVTAILLCFFIVLQSVFALVKERKSK